MTRSIRLFAILLLSAFGALAASAEPFPPENFLTPTQKLGPDLFAQHRMDSFIADNEETGRSNDGGESHEA